MLKFEIRNIIVDEEILGEVHLEFVSNIGVDTVKMTRIGESKCNYSFRLNYLVLSGILV
jgi:hypothetical protein